MKDRTSINSDYLISLIGIKEVENNLYKEQISSLKAALAKAEEKIRLMELKTTSN